MGFNLGVEAFRLEGTIKKAAAAPEQDQRCGRKE